MKKTILTIATMALIATGCNKKADLTSGIDLNNLDTTASPVDDFYQYACGGWMATHPLTPEYARYGSFDKLAEDNREQLKGLIDEITAAKNTPGTNAQKIADLYNSAMDSANLNEHYWGALEEFLLCDGYQCSPAITENWLNDVWPRMQRQGVPGLFAMYIGADEKDSKNNLVNIYQGGLTLGQKD